MVQYKTIVSSLRKQWRYNGLYGAMHVGSTQTLPDELVYFHPIMRFELPRYLTRVRWPSMPSGFSLSAELAPGEREVNIE